MASNLKVDRPSISFKNTAKTVYKINKKAGTEDFSA